MLGARLEDPVAAVRLQAAHFLSLLNDQRTEKRIDEVRKQTERERLVRSPSSRISEVWVVGPLDDEDQGFERVHAVEPGPVCLGDRGCSERLWVEALESCREPFAKLGLHHLADLGEGKRGDAIL